MSCFHRKWNIHGRYLHTILSDDDIPETVKYKNRHFMYQHSETGKFHTKYGYFTDLTDEQRDQYVLTEIIFDFAQIEKDVLESRYTPRSTLDLRRLEYHEFVVRKNMGFNVWKLHILDCKTFTFKPIDYYDEQFEILCDYHVPNTALCAKEIIDTSLAESLLSTLIPNKNKILEFRQLCYRIFVEPQAETRIFYDYYRDTYHLTILLNNIFYQLYGKPSLESRDYFTKNKVWKTKKTANIRYAVVRENQHYSIDKMMHEFKNMGIRNIVVCVRNPKQNIYQEMPFLRLVEANCKKIKKQFNVTGLCPCAECMKIKKRFDEFDGEIQQSIKDGNVHPNVGVFYLMPEMMFINFFKYVVTKV
jgi:hypothetical protein